MKKIRTILAITVVALGTICGFRSINGNVMSNDLIESNIESLAFGDFYKDQILVGYAYGTYTANGKTIACCVSATDIDECNYSETNCKTSYYGF